MFASDLQEKGSTLTIVSLDLDQPRRQKTPASNGIALLFEKNCMHPAAFAYKMLTALNEHILVEEENYIISKPHKSSTDKESFSILFYNLTDKVRLIAAKEQSLEDTYLELDSFNDRAEILVKISGMTGEYKLSR